MTVLKYSALALFLLSTSNTRAEELYKLENKIKACFDIKISKITYHNELMLLNITLHEGTPKPNCPCKSTSFSYASFQVLNHTSHNLVSASFTTAGRKNVVIPIATQKQITFKNTPITITFSCNEA